MPRHASLTTVCGRLARLGPPRRADLHVHTTASDGEFTPAQVVAIARRAGLAAVAVTDHDTLAAVEPARAAAGDQIEVVPGVEISAGFAGREIHLLGYFIRADHSELNSALARLCERRRERFRDFVAKLADCGTPLPEDRVRLTEETAPSLGRRHVAGLLEACGLARSRAEAFHKFLWAVGGRVLPKLLLPADEAIRLVRAAGGVAALAHPPPDFTEEHLRTLAGFGLSAVETEYPWGRNSPAARLRELAGRLGLAVTGGSDCHGPHPSHRVVGSYGVTVEQLAALRERTARIGSGSPGR
jgi:predicted metal-dependent phosphoesterase TrpH